MTYNKLAQKQMTAWWQSPQGQYVAHAEQRWLQQRVAGFAGYFHLQIGGHAKVLPVLSRPSYQAWLDAHGQFDADPQHLPLQSDSVDQLVIQHALEFSNDPHQLLREADRVLAADGSIIIFCFNPFSLWGLRRIFTGSSSLQPWQGHFFSRMRLKDWLKLLNFEIVESHSFLYKPPLSRQKSLINFAAVENWGRRFWPFFGAITVIVAKKRTIILTPLRDSWHKQSLFPRPGLTTRPLSREIKNGSC